MTASVAQLVEEALRLPDEARAELVEAILERSRPSPEFMSEWMETVKERMADVEGGRSPLIPAEEAHRQVRDALAALS